ncbi:MAG: polysaccharide biosynthesis protein [Firmicutes bacterium]|nr:polysaccharide biosynthesis protein [Bacillota bacterium]
MKTSENLHQKKSIRWALVLYDLLIYIATSVLLFVIYRGSSYMTTQNKWIQLILAYAFIMLFRAIFHVYGLVWRYGGIQSYLKLMLSDFCAFLAFTALRLTNMQRMTAVASISLFTIELLLCLAMRMSYRYTYKFGNQDNWRGKILRSLYHLFSGDSLSADVGAGTNKINIAIIGAGRVGTSLASELLGNPASAYLPRCYVDVNEEKIGKNIFNVPVLSEEEATIENLSHLEIQEVVMAVTSQPPEQKKAIYERYKGMGFKVKVYDYPTMRTAGSKKSLREFDIDELLFRREIDIKDEKTYEYFRGKTTLVTGGGGSIGSEICRQIARMDPRQLIILDVYENGAYDLQQELRLEHGNKLNLKVEILSICNRPALERVFDHYRPNIVINAAAHKHVPLMEHNVIEAVENNVFGTLNAVELAEKYGAERFMMVSTDKAVNPTNVMGATKRMCEMICQAHSQNGSGTSFSATRFGNVLGSAGSVIPLFKKQILNGGPITITDKRIIRYFMTIPEASSLVLQSGVMAKNGELFVLDMGQPVKILDLAENLIRLSGLEPYKDIEIIETGLRPGEKLYEELLVRDEGLDKTSNELIFIERDKPLSMSELGLKLGVLKTALATESDASVKEALKSVVPTYRDPDVVNASARNADEFRNTRMFTPV